MMYVLHSVIAHKDDIYELSEVIVVLGPECGTEHIQLGKVLPHRISTLLGGTPLIRQTRQQLTTKYFSLITPTTSTTSFQP